MSGSKKYITLIVIGLVVAVLVAAWVEAQEELKYHRNEGTVFGTYYNIRYKADEDLQDSIEATLAAFDNSLSMFNPASTLSAINANLDMTTDAAFEAMFAEAARVYALSGGAFDITVAPLVNYWGFGSRGSTPAYSATAQDIEAMRRYVGFDKVQLIDHTIIKQDPRVQLDGGAVAKGQACDMVAAMLRRQGCKHYLVEIGGEVVAHGHNDKGSPWHVGITKPNLNNEGAQDELQEILDVTDICMATSGNYRNYYYADGERRSHTIDPRTGYPVQHSLLSATVVSTSCMRADALATACMVLGANEALQMIESTDDAACYLIVSFKNRLAVMRSANWEEKIK